MYDGTNGATLTFNCGSTGCLVGAIPGDNVALNQQQYNAIFSSTGPGNGIPVIVDLSLLGTDAGNYTITFPASAFIADIFAPSTQDVSSILQAAYLNEIGRPQAIANATDLMMMNSLNACRAHYKRHLNDSSFGIDFDCPTYKQLNRE